MPWQLARLPTGQGWAVGFDVLAADPARAPSAATPLRLLAEKTGKPSEYKTSISKTQGPAGQSHRTWAKLFHAPSQTALLLTSCMTLGKLLNFSGS